MTRTIATTVVLLLAAHATAAVAETGGPLPATPANGSTAIVDVVAQGRQSQLHGFVIPYAAAPAEEEAYVVEAFRREQRVAAAHTDRHGAFALKGLKGGVYRITVHGRSMAGEATCRFWTASAAPPAAASTLSIGLTPLVVRGQVTMPLPSLRQTAIIGGVLGAAVAAPIIYAEAQENHQVPASP